PNVVALETRAPSVEGSGAVDVRALLRAALRMRPDRIVVGEVRGGEALDMLQAMNTGHRGSLTTAHFAACIVVGLFVIEPPERAAAHVAADAEMGCAEAA